MKKIHIAFILVILVSSSFAQVKSTVTQSSVTFKIKNMCINTGGNFSGLQANIQFKPADLPGSSIEASVDAASVNTENSMRDSHLKGADYFDVATYPRITLK